MLVVNVGHDKLLLTEYNGKKYAFHRGVPVNISPEIYNSIILSGHVNAKDVVPVEPPAPTMVHEKPTIAQRAAEAVKKVGKPKKNK